jgi:hypothetical protein
MTAKPAGKDKPALRGFDKDLAELEELALSFRAGAPLIDEGVRRIQKALAHKNNFLVSKAAKLVAEAELAELLPEVLAAYDRFFVDAASTDPQCWAKTALAKALVKLEHRQKDAFLHGLRHIQLEGSWGGSTDTAGALRANCLHGLLDCPGLSDAELLAYLAESLVDADKTVRMEAARAIGNVGGVSSALLLRLRLHLGLERRNHEEEEPEVLGACFSALLSLEGERAVPLVASALKEGDELSAEAAYALAEARTPAAWLALQQRWRAGADAWFASVLLSAMALTRLSEALDFLIAMIENDAREAPAAIEAIARSAPGEELCFRIRRTVEQTGSPRLQKALAEHLPSVRN